MTFKLLFAIVVYHNLDTNSMDVKTIFLYIIIDQLVYIQISKSSETSANKRMTCKLLKVLYNLKQALKLWYKRLSKFLFEKLDLN